MLSGLVKERKQRANFRLGRSSSLNMPLERNGAGYHNIAIALIMGVNERNALIVTVMALALGDFGATTVAACARGRHQSR